VETVPQQTHFDGLRIVLFGPESTGKTTLSQQLASHFNELAVPEYAREYLQEKFDQSGKICELHDIMPIVSGQRELENKLVDTAGDYLFCDTDPLETLVYSQVYFQEAPGELHQVVRDSHYDLYLLMDIDVPWTADDLRDKPLERAIMFEKFKLALKQYQCNYAVISGLQHQRLQNALQAIKNYNG
jgi:NadR type nicotinamide-nucleotide adenylyltransferase